MTVRRNGWIAAVTLLPTSVALAHGEQLPAIIGSFVVVLAGAVVWAVIIASISWRRRTEIVFVAVVTNVAAWCSASVSSW